MIIHQEGLFSFSHDSKNVSGKFERATSTQYHVYFNENEFKEQAGNPLILEKQKSGKITFHFESNLIAGNFYSSLQAAMVLANAGKLLFE